MMNYALSTILNQLIQIKSDNISFYQLLIVGIIFGYLISSAINRILSYICTIFLGIRLDINSKIGYYNSLDSNNISEKPATVPKHIAVIMDGNRRFGRKKHKDALQGHWSGGQTLIDFIKWCMIDGVEILTVYAFSTENWGRDTLEVSTLMSIFAKYADSFKKEALEKNVKVIVLCTDDTLLPLSVKSAVKSLVESTKDCSGFIVNICLSYGSRAEIVNACKSVVNDCNDGKIEVNNINEITFSNYLSTKGISDPDILIRTSGEYRLSNFLLWQLAYTEMFFIDKYWPEINHSDLRFIMNKFYDRKRRFGL